MKILFYLCLSLFLLFPVTGLSQYEIIEIDEGIILDDINNNLECVGRLNENPILWRNGIITFLDLPPTAQNFTVRAINDNGLMVGTGFTTGMDNSVMAKWDTSGALLYFAQNTFYSDATDINNNNIASGWIEECYGCGKKPVLWQQNNSYTIISNIDAPALGINESNWVAGSGYTETGRNYPYVWKGGGNLIILPEPAGEDTSTIATHLNENGFIVGYNFDRPGDGRPVYWINEQLFLPPFPIGYDRGRFLNLNSANQIVGYVGALNPNIPNKGVLFENGEIKFLNDLIPPNSGWDIIWAHAITDQGTILTYGYKDGVQRNCILKPLFLSITQPVLNEKWIAGEVDTIKWSSGQAGQLLQIEFSTDNGSSYELLDFGIPADSGYYIWQIPDTILTTKARIKLTDMVNNQVYSESETFRIKPYVLTRIDENGDYYEYRNNSDQWGFSNIPGHMWPLIWYVQFDYWGIDPFTGSQYSQWQAGGSFSRAHFANHPDWISWVNTFSVDACYFSTTLRIYRSAAVLKWRSKVNSWGGSCFGIAVANALAFRYKEEFQNRYPNYPDFLNPITVASDTGVKRVVNELFTHQFGNPHLNIRTTIGMNKTPKETLNELIEMFKQDESQIRTLSFLNNGAGGGGHAILAYGLEKDQVNQSLFHILVYDNSYPDSTTRITIDTSANANNGSWTNPLWPGWGGTKWIYLRNPTVEYLVNPTLPARNFNQSPFILDQAELQVINKTEGEIRISDEFGNATGFYDNLIHLNIPGSVPFVVDNGSETPPYGYSLQTDNYSVILNEFEEDTLSTFFFTDNISFMYERNGAEQTETDRLFFDGGVSVANPDAQTKTVKLLNLINETTQEKLTVIRSIELAQNDSVKIENPDSNKVKLISYGSAKDYDIELNYVTENGFGRFGDFNIQLTANTSHTFVPDWPNISNSQLVVLVDIGNNGTIDDTLYISNIVDVEDQGSLITPDSYNLAQNYPNPFNPVTTIQYSIPQKSNVTLKVYDVIGNEIATLVNEEKDRGVYSVDFDASGLASGIYLYHLQADSFVETKKMILIR